MPAPVYRSKALAVAGTIARLARFVGWQTESPDPAPKLAPDAEGTWIYTLTGSRLRVVKKLDGTLVFPAGEWREEEATVEEIRAAHEASPTLKQYGFIQIFRCFDV